MLTNNDAVWEVGDFALLQRDSEPVAGVVKIQSVSEKPKHETEKHFGVRAITAILDWSSTAETMRLARMPGEEFNVHFSELHVLTG